MYKNLQVPVGVYQGQPVKGDVSANLAIVEAILEEASAKHLELVLFPELFLTGYDLKKDDLQALAVSSPDGLGDLSRLAKQYSCGLAIGYPEIEGTTYYNSCVLIDSEGNQVLNYRKTHLWDPELVHEKLIFSAGNSLPFCDFPLPRMQQTIRIGILICFDGEFPEPSRVMALNGVNLLLIPTALTESGEEDPSSTMVIPTRALENNVFIIYSNPVGTCDLVCSPSKPIPRFSGRSAIIGPNGKDLARADTTSIGLYTAVLEPSKYVEHIRRNDYLVERRPELYEIISSTSVPKTPKCRDNESTCSIM